VIKVKNKQESQPQLLV